MTIRAREMGRYCVTTNEESRLADASLIAARVLFKG